MSDTSTEASSLTFPSLKAAAAASGIPYSVLQAMKAEGLPGFETSGRVKLDRVLAAFFSRGDGTDVAPPAGLRNWREALNKAQAERQQLRLQRERGAVVDRAWVSAAIVNAAQDLNRARLKSESDHALKFAETNGDVPECRAIVRSIWDDIFRSIQGLSHHLSTATQDDQTPNT